MAPRSALGTGSDRTAESRGQSGVALGLLSRSDSAHGPTGELVRATYVARNNSDQTITANAIHEVGPASAFRYFQTIQCFCFTEQTLEPGEEREMTLVFRIDFAAPRELESIENRYTFYSLDEFPSEG